MRIAISGAVGLGVGTVIGLVLGGVAPGIVLGAFGLVAGVLFGARRRGKSDV